MGKDRSLNRLRAIIDQTPMAMICFDHELHVTEWNKAATQQLGVIASDAKGESVLRFFPPNGDLGPERWKTLAEAHGAIDLLGQAKAGNDETFMVRLIVSVLDSDSEQPEFLLCFVRDLQDRQLETEALLRTDEAKQRADLLNALADGEINNREVAIQRGKALGLDLAAKYALFAISIDDYAGKSYEELQKDQRGMQEVLRQVTQICSAEQDKIVWTRYDGFAVLCPLPEPCADVKGHALTRARSGKERVIRHMPGVRLTVGVSSSYTDILDIRRCYREAREAANVGRRVWGGNDVYHYADLGICQLLTQFQDAGQLQEFVDQSIGKLIQYDKTKKAGLVATLEEILSAPTLKEAAERSFVHHKTILQRKTRIEEILSVSIDDVETRLTLATAMKILRLLPVSVHG